MGKHMPLKYVSLDADFLSGTTGRVGLCLVCLSHSLHSMSTVLSILLWPLVVYHELIQRMYTRLEPVLMKLDYSMKAETLHHKHEKKSKDPPSLWLFLVLYSSGGALEKRTIGDHICQHRVVKGCRGVGEKRWKLKGYGESNCVLPGDPENST